MAITFETPKEIGGTASVARKQRIIIDTNPNGPSVDVEVQYGNYVYDAVVNADVFVPIDPVKIVNIHIAGAYLLPLIIGHFDETKTRWDAISDDLDDVITAMGVL